MPLAPVSVGGAPPLKEPTQHPPAMYNIFAFSINALSEGNHSFGKDMFDPLARHPLWHAIPIASDHAQITTDRYPLAAGFAHSGSFNQ